MPALVPLTLSDEQADQPVDGDRWAELSRRVLETEGAPASAELSVRFVDTATITELNERYLGGQGPTDVLAFPLDDLDHPPPAGPALLGDVVICPAVAAANAAHRGGTVDDELALLVVHGILHVMGHDHADPAEAARMEARQRNLLARFHRR